MSRRFVTIVLSAAIAVGCSAAAGGGEAVERDRASNGALATAPLGASFHGDGTTFRVWAPDAQSVGVRGDFDQWTEPGEPMHADGDGVFSLDVPGALAGMQYEYELTSNATTVHRADPRSKQVVDHDGAFGNSVIVDPDSYRWQTTGYSTPSFDQQVVYELHIGTFVDTNGPGTGTWKSATTKLDWLAALGVNVLEVLPVNEFQGNYSWGYNPSFPYAPESSYGTPDEMKAFVDAAHARGMAVIVDVVHNHYGPELGRSLWCFDGPCLGNGGVYFYSDWRKDTGFGARPDFGRREVRDYVVDDAMMWLREFRVDGLRWDSTVNMRRAWNAADARTEDIDNGWPLLQRINDTVDGEQPWKIMIAEDLQNDSWITKPTSQGGAGFDAQWEPEFYYPMHDALTAIDDRDRDMHRVAYAITHGYDGVATHRLIFTENHDQVAPQNGTKRIAESICPGLSDGCKYYAEKRTTLGLAVLMTTPGIPMLFQGQEFVDDTPFPFGKDVGIDWSKADRFAGITKMTADLVHLRRNWNDQTRGLSGDNVDVFHVNDGAKVVAYHRWANGGPGDDVVVVANFGSVAFPGYDIGMPRAGLWHVRFNGDWSGYSPDFAGTPSNDTWASDGGKDGLPFHATVGVGPYSVVILSQ